LGQGHQVKIRAMTGYTDGTGLRLLQRAQRLRVPAGFILAPLVVVASKPTVLSLAMGSVLGLVGLGVRAWASGCLKKNEELATAGPYAYTRNPLYLGTLVMGGGVAVCTDSLWFAVFFAVFYILFYVPVMIAEADTLGKLFPDEYAAYRKRTPLLLPRLTRFAPVPWGRGRKSSSGPVFDSALYMRHREYRALVGFLVVLSVLILKSRLSL
jgi:protein-S-isoprenylcysteine O-methyltransferase Ste14